MLHWFFCLLCLIAVGCSNTRSKEYVSPRYVIVAQEIRYKLERELSEKYNMRVIGTVGGLAKYVNLLGLHFQIQGPLPEEQLRTILVGCVEAFLYALNSNEEIRPYLKMYPFQAEGIEIGIFVIDSTGREIFSPNIGLADVYRGTVEYVTIDRVTQNQTTTKSESFSEALQIVHLSDRELRRYLE